MRRKRPFMQIRSTSWGRYRWTCFICQIARTHHIGTSITWRVVFNDADEHARDLREQHEWAVANNAEARARFGMKGTQ